MAERRAPELWTAPGTAPAPVRDLAPPTRGVRRAIKLGALLLGVSLLIGTAILAIRALPGRTLWLAIPGCLLGIGAADLVSGVVHWAADTYGDERTPVFGGFIGTFRVHHTDPADITRHDPVEANADVFLFSAPVHCLLLWWLRDGVLLSFLFGLFAASYPTSQLHKWAHLRQRPPLVSALQKAGLLLGPEHHARHHCGEHAAAYCIATGWLNPLLDGVGFFRALERLLRAIGVFPARERVAANAE